MAATATSAEVFLPGALRVRADGAERVRVSGATVAELISALEEAHPGMRFSLCYETGELRSFVNIFVNGTNVRYLAGLETPVPLGARVDILPSVAGG